MFSDSSSDESLTILERNIDDLVKSIDGPQSFVRNALKAIQQQTISDSNSGSHPSIT